jgi:hypothetical protein
VSDCFPQELACNNTETNDNFRSGSDGNKFRVPASNPGEQDRLQEISETTPESKFIPGKIQLNRKITEAASGPPQSRRRSIEFSTFNSLEELNLSFQRLEVTPIMGVRICGKREEPLLYPQVQTM